MTHRVIEIEFRPKSARQWRIHGSVRGEAARLWDRLVRMHAYIRRRQWKWPGYKDLRRWAKGKFSALHSGSVQEIIDEFLEAVDSARRKRKKGDTTARYPWKRSRYRAVGFTNQAPRFKHGRIALPCGKLDGKRSYLFVPLPKGFEPPGKLAEARLEFNKLALVYDVADQIELAEPQGVVGVDPGVNTLLGAADGEKVVLVSGRAVKAMVQYRNKALAEIVRRQSFHTKGSKRHRGLQKAKKRMLAKMRRKVRDAAHKATRIVANAFPNHKAIMGKPFNDAARKIGRITAQTVSQAVNGLLARYLNYKMAGVEQIEEHYTSQTCPVCAERNKCARIYRCGSCGFRAPRDAVGSFNIRTKGMTGEIQRVSLSEFPTYITYLRVPASCTRSSSGGHPASSSDPQPLHKAA